LVGNVYLVPGKLRHFFSALAGQCQELDNAGIGAIHLPGGFYDSGEFVIIEDTVTRSLARRGS
jgi:hypothetical protein